MKKLFFISRAYIKGNTKSDGFVWLTAIFTASLILVSCFSLTLTSALNEYKNDYRSRSLEADPFMLPLEDEVIEQMKSVEHVEDVYMKKGMRSQYLCILDIDDKSDIDEMFLKKMENRVAYTEAWSQMGNENKAVVAGKTLDESPSFSCIVPSSFYPYYYEGDTGENLEYIDGRDLLGKTFTVIPNGGEYFEDMYFYHDDQYDCYPNEWFYLPALEYQLTVVGVYYNSPVGYGGYDSIFVSEETGILMEEMAIEASDIDFSSNDSDVAKWWNSSGLRVHYVLVDDNDNIPEVYNAISGMGVTVSNSPELHLSDSVKVISSIINVAGRLLVAAVLILCIFTIVQSITLSLSYRKGELGLMKAIGYKNKDIFNVILFENLYLSIKGFLFGGASAAVVLLITNTISNHGNYSTRLYIVKWSDYLFFLGFSLILTILLTIFCQSVSLRKMLKIAPRDAMA